MKGQFVFEFLIAGLIFFTIIIYTINYLNTNVTDYKEKFHQSWLQNKAVQISEVLMGEGSPLSLTENGEFNLTKIQNFNLSYCNPDGNYRDLIEDLHLFEKTNYGLFAGNVRIVLSLPGEVLMDCGPRIPGSPRAETRRVGVFNGNIAKLDIVVW